tara:strand:- start:363 stop:770 length:408 start_codon:yes stop_codon:yes gene_type:complete
MAVTVTPQTLDTGATLIVSTAVNSTLEPDVTGGGCRMHSIKLVNAHSSDAFFKIWDGDGSSVTVGTTAPDFILYAPGSDTVTYTFTDTAATGGGVALTGMSIACVKNVGVADGPGTEGSTDPDGNVSLTAIVTPT